MSEAITICGARQHNLRDITVAVPKSAFTVISGVSGSGKSSLAFDTLYAEGQRSYVESLSTYARQFLERLEKPDVDRIDGIQPAIAIRQHNTIQSSRSTVGTATEIYDYLRLLFARIGHIFCPKCGQEVVPDTPDRAVRRVRAQFVSGTRLLVTYPMRRSASLEFEELRTRLQMQGYLRAIFAGQLCSLEEPWSQEPAPEEEFAVIADRLELQEGEELRLAEAIEGALHAGEGRAAVRAAADFDAKVLALDVRTICARCNIALEPPTPQLFSFNNPHGACPACNGFGERLEFDERRIVPDLDRSLGAGAIRPWASDSFTAEFAQLLQQCETRKVPIDVPFRRLPAPHRRWVLEGDADFVGVIPWLAQLRDADLKEGHRFFTRRYMGRSTCRVCEGARLRPAARAVRIEGVEIGALCRQTVPEVRAFCDGLQLVGNERKLAGDVLEELRDRLRFLEGIGLHYLSLDRASRTLSGGEMQRIHLSNALGGRLVETLYVLDEPSIGLHPLDTHRLIESLRELAELGNTVVVVEHDLEVLRAADRLIDLGPGAGREGGRLLYAGPPPRAGEADPSAGASLSCQYLCGLKAVPMRQKRRTPGRRRLTLKNARLHNLRGIDVTIPLGLFVGVSGVSGSGKSSLVSELLYPALSGQISGGSGRSFGFDSLHGSENVNECILVDQTPIGRSARSNPATYLQVFGDIRELLADTLDARQRGFSSGRFSFNIPGGRCPTCQGMGEISVEMHFMADITVPCDQCHGKRYEPSTLEVRYRGLNVFEILGLTIDQAIAFFADSPAIGSRLWLLQRVGLGYLQLGQPASTLSGGESQRIKIARELMGGRKGHTLYLLDEPTTGLHPEDVRRLVTVLDELVAEGHSVLVIEHNLDLLKNADYVLDLGPGGGSEGGKLVVAGPPESLAANSESVTGRYLAPLLVGEGEST